MSEYRYNIREIEKHRKTVFKFPIVLGYNIYISHNQITRYTCSLKQKCSNNVRRKIIHPTTKLNELYLNYFSKFSSNIQWSNYSIIYEGAGKYGER